MSDESAANAFFQQGRFLDAERATDKRTSPGLALEIAYMVGRSPDVRATGRSLLRNRSVDKPTKARIYRVMGSLLRDEGEFAEALSSFRAALDILEGEDAPIEIAQVCCCLLESECDSIAFDGSRPTALQTRRAALRTGTPLILASTHHTFGRLEARFGNLDRALRHFAVARETVAASSNLFLRAAVDLDEASARSLLGEFHECLALAESAFETASVCGWSKGIVAAAANCAFFLVALGDLERAGKYLELAESREFKSPSYELALLETRAQLALAQGDLTRAEELLQSRQGSVFAGSWYALAAAETEIRVLTRQQKWNEASRTADEALKLAMRRGLRAFVVSFTLQRALILAAQGGLLRSVDVPSSADWSDWSLSNQGSFWLLRGLASADSYRSVDHARRATHLFEAVGQRSSQQDAEALIQRIGRFPPPPPTLDGAVALLEVAGHPQILAREALALLQGSGCVDQAALVSRGAKALRVLESFGWDERDALQAARRSSDTDWIDCGSHRDETLLIVSRPHDDLERRCTWIAIKKLVLTARTLDRFRRDEKQRAALWPAESLEGDPDVIWVSEPINEVVRIARRIGPTPLSVLLTGETGTGKEMLARTIHLSSDRADKTMLAFNCTAVPRDMLESQLFGYRKGAFTGADTSFTGVIRAAEGGTLFLDEIADVPVDVQPKLLRFLETHEIHPLGEPHPSKVDVRIIAATNANLEQLVAQGRFRQDLFYRLNVVRLRLPPLRERREEIPALVEHYVRRYGEQQKKGRLAVSDEALEYLLLYPWPGNLRQLANEVNRMVAMAEPDTTFTAAHLSAEIRANRRTIAAAVAPESEFRINLDQPLPDAVDQLERTMVQAALDQSKGRLEDAAKILGISRKGLFLKRRRWGLQQT